MNEFVIVGLLAFIVVATLAVGIQWRFGNGLLTKLFRSIMMLIGFVGYGGFVLGRVGATPANFIAIAGLAVALIIFVVIIIQRNVISRVQDQADAVSRVVNNLSTTSAEAAATAEEQASAVTQVSSAVEEIHQMSQNTADTSQDVATIAEEAFSQGHQGMESIREALHIMERLSQTADFVEVVNQVAEQSNLLAFNAGIEAAKAEEFGRGFSVVASEVRNLAEQSKQAANQIRESIRHTEAGQKAIQTTDSVMTELGLVLKETSEKARQISGAAIQQASGIKQISDAMSNLIRSGKHSAEASGQIKQAAGELFKVTEQLSLLIHGEGTRKSRNKESEFSSDRKPYV